MRKLEELMPLPQAAQSLGLTAEALTRLVENGIIKANVHQGEILVPESQVKQTITREQFAELKGMPITMAEASKKYNVPYSTLIGWVHNKLGMITVIKSGYGMQIDEADVAYCAAIHRMRRKSSRLFDEAGRPYQLKRPEIAAYRQRRAKEERRAHA